MRIIKVAATAATLFHAVVLGDVSYIDEPSDPMERTEDFSALISAATTTTQAAPSTHPASPQKRPAFEGLEKKIEAKIEHKIEKKETPATPEITGRVSIYTHPGIIGMKDGTWLGSDNLYNLSPEMGLVMDLIKPEGKDIPISVEEIKAVTKATLEKYGIKVLESHEGKPLPFLHLLVMVLPVERNNYVVSADGRLFEEILSTRVSMEKGVYWQGITWEKEDLFFVPKNKLKEQVESSFTAIATSFGERYKFFTDLKNSRKDRD